MNTQPFGHNLVCPRCGGGIPSDGNIGAYPGALSRVDNKTEICSECGTDEALREYMKLPALPIDKWPVGVHIGDIL